ncbi:MAG: RecQ family ATP-dependent DNA helicase [Phascolarctobacterium sp.]|nr:RecQ family ATP-dependent DNA helicase [Phascolarctobacterium sp.]
MEINSDFLHRALKYYFGYDEFRRGQEEIVGSILKGQPVLAVLPTGAGKSICFQLPSLLLKGVTLVISPLISLMKDQAENLTKKGIPAAYLDSSMTGNAYGKILYDVLNKQCKFLYVAPERLSNEQFIAFAQKANITMIAVDEAHCVSQWGRSFRKDYYQIPNFIRLLPRKPLLAAFTASATPDVRMDIIERLEMKNAKQVITGFDRVNLYFEVQRTYDKQRSLLEYLANHKDECGIIYCATRANVETITQLLLENGYTAIRYHAGLTPTERRDNQNTFIEERANIVVATNAFGMGIDKPNVRFVIHYNMPKDLESYYQEAGRAGRDGKASECILLYSREDSKINNYLIENGEGDSEVKKAEFRLLEQMSIYCNTSVCLRRYMLQYFGEEFQGNCGNCGSCKQNKKADWRRFFGI